MTEPEMINAAQDGVGTTKVALKLLQDHNANAGRHMAANAAMGLLAELTAWHAKAMKELNEHYPELAVGVATRGGGGR